MWLLNLILTKKMIVLIYMLNLVEYSCCLRAVQIIVPRAVRTGSDVTLSCTYDLEGVQLYSIRWYKAMTEFYRYVPKESPATRVFPVAGIKVDVSLSDDRKVILNNVDDTLSGEYQCEVSADAPLFHTDIKAAEMIVVVPPKIGPTILADRTTYSGGEHIRVNCTTGPSKPSSNITWYVNSQKVPGHTTQQKVDTISGNIITESTLQLEAAVQSPVASLIIRCESTLYDVWSSSSDTLELKERTANPVSALGRSFTGGVTSYGAKISTCLVTSSHIIASFVINQYFFTFR